MAKKDISELIDQMFQNPKNFPMTFLFMAQQADQLRHIWLKMASLHSLSTVKQGGTGWWGRNYVDNGNIKQTKRGWKYFLSYEKKEGSRIDFERVVERGRGPLDIVQTLLSVSGKVRYKKDGQKYLIVPLPASKEKPVDFYMSIKGTYRDEMGVKRNKYDYKEGESGQKGNTAGFYQKHERGGGSMVKKNLVTINGQTIWKPYPAIKAQNYKKKMKAEADQMMASSQLNKDLAEAVMIDLGDYVKKKNKNLYAYLVSKKILR